MLFKFFMFIGGDEEINMMNEWMNEWMWWMNVWRTLIEAKSMDGCGGEGRVPQLEIL
jgi:hypothetical protein